MKKVILVLLFVFLISNCFAEESEAVSAISVDLGYDVIRAEDNSCNISDTTLDAITELVLNNIVNDSYYYNITNTYCYNYGDYKSISVVFMVKDNESSIIGESVNVNFYTSTVYDYNTVFSSDELDLFGYSLKEKYVDYLLGGEDEELYLMLSSYDSDCDDLRDYFNTLSGEKYFNNDYYCSIVVKDYISNLKSYNNAPVDYINYFGDSVSFNFKGYSQGDFNLDYLYNSLDCDIRDGNYYPESETNCYGVYKENSRLYFSIYEEVEDMWLNLYVYGIIGGKVEISVSAYGESVDLELANEWFDTVMSTYFPSYNIDLVNHEDNYYYNSQVFNDFSFDLSTLSNFKSYNNEMNTVYESDNIYASYSEPYIQINVLNSSNSDNSNDMIVPYPYYRGNSFVITQDKIYSSIVLEENNEELAVNSIKSLLDNYISTNDWVLNMSVFGGVYYYGLIDDAFSGMETADSIASSNQNINNANFDSSKFDDLETEDTILSKIISFFYSLIR